MLCFLKEKRVIFRLTFSPFWDEEKLSSLRKITKTSKTLDC